MSASTLALKNNIVTRKQLVGIANFVRRNSEARFLSRGTQILSTEQEIRTTKKAQVLITLLQGIKKVQEVLSQAKAGGVKSSELSINEFIVDLANEMITDPIIYRPRDGEVLTAEGIMGRVSGSYEITATTAKDRAYYENILHMVKNGLELAVGGTKLQGRIVKSALDTSHATADEVKDNATKFANQIRFVRNKIKKTKDRLIQSKISNKDIAIVINNDGETVLENDARYNMYTETAVNKNGAIDLEIDAMFDKSPVIVSKQLPAGVDFIVMMFGSAVSLFALRNKMNFDKIPMVDAYGSSMEFDEGTGVFLPHMIAVGVNDATAEQDAKTFDDLVLSLDKSTTVSGNKDGSQGLPAPTANDDIVAEDVNRDGNIADDELVTFDAKKWYSANYATDKAELTAGQIRSLKQSLGVANNAIDSAVQTELDKRA